jgi:hypothetical protein
LIIEAVKEPDDLVQSMGESSQGTQSTFGSFGSKISIAVEVTTGNPIAAYSRDLMNMLKRIFVR